MVGGVDSVAPFITVNEQSESNPDSGFTLLFHYLLPGDHINIMYFYITSTVNPVLSGYMQKSNW